MTAAGYGEFAHLGLPSPASVAVTQAYIALVVLVGWVLAQEVAGRMSAVQDRDSARLERAIAEARREAAELGVVLADAATVNSVGDQVSAAVRARLDAAQVVISVLAADGRRFEPLAGGDAAAQVAVNQRVDDRFRRAGTARGPGPRSCVPQRPEGGGRGDRVHGRASCSPRSASLAIRVRWAGPREATAAEPVSADHGRDDEPCPGGGSAPAGRTARARAGRDTRGPHQAARRGADPRGDRRGSDRLPLRGRRRRRRAIPRRRRPGQAGGWYGSPRPATPGRSANSSRTCR